MVSVQCEILSPTKKRHFGDILINSANLTNVIFFQIYIANPGENEIDNANTKYDEIRANFIHLATKVAGMEQRENVYYEQIIASLIDFWGLHRSLSLEINFKPDQLVDLIATFYRVTKLKTELLQRLLRALYDLRTGKPIEMKRLTQLPNLVACLQEFSVCINAEVIANRLSSPQVRVDAHLIRVNGIH